MAPDKLICPSCGGEVKYIRTYSDWIDGDEDDIYECVDCKKQITIYIPR